MGLATIYPILKSRLPENPVILEAGAHIGRDTKKLSAYWPKGHIHAFEPVPALFEQLQHNTKNLLNVSCYPFALAATSGSAILHVSSGRSTATSSLLQPIATEHLTTIFSPQSVKTITLADWAQQYHLDHIDFFWLDMQGSELDVLKSGENLVKTAKAIFVEISLLQRYEKTPLYPEIKEWLEQRGFFQHHLTMIKSIWGNALFLR
jgi:2-O-methyltransferase